MSQRAGGYGASNTTCSPGQMLILIGSDGVRATVSRAIATEASYVLRDLLDGVDGAPGATGAGLSSSLLPEATDAKAKEATDAPINAAAPSLPQQQQPRQQRRASQLDDLFLVNDNESPSSESEDFLCSVGVGHKGHQQHQQQQHQQQHPPPPPPAAGASKNEDIMDLLFSPPTETSSHQPSTASAKTSAQLLQLDSLFGPSPTPTDSAATATATATHAESSPLPPLPPSRNESATRVTAPADGTQVEEQKQQKQQVAVVPPIELPFPYFTGHILQQVCQHMTYRFRISSFGATEDGCFRVYPIKTREIPRPMTMPLSEYLDAQDRKFIQNWDELTTVLMVKCATLLNYEELLNLASAKLATYLMDRSVEGMRTLLGVDSDFSPQEEAELKKEFQHDGWK